MQERDLSLKLIISQTASERNKIFAKMTDEEVSGFGYDWHTWARPEQCFPPDPWRTWLILAGRGFGKTRAGAEAVRAWAESGLYKHIGIIGATVADTRDIMVEGVSGIMAVCPPWNRPHYEPSKRRLTWHNGCTVTTYSADIPDRLRGANFDAIWADELAAWRYAEAWDMAILGLRLGKDPRAVVTTTPRPVKILRDLLQNENTVVTRGKTHDNFENLASAFIDQIVQQYEGTRLGRQELYAELLEDTPGALWTRAMIDDHRIFTAPEFARVVVAIDPATTSGDKADETGIIVAGKCGAGKGYVIADLSCRKSPDAWARIAVQAYHDYSADRIVAETNQGGEMVKQVIRTVDPAVSYKSVHASRGKHTRAEPVAALYEQGRVAHVGSFDRLEDQMVQFVADNKSSPDRVDALVYALTELCLGAGPRPQFRAVIVGR